MTLTDKISKWILADKTDEWIKLFAFGTAFGGIVTGVLVTNKLIEYKEYAKEIYKPDALLSLGDINGDRQTDYIITDSLGKNDKGEDIGRGFLFLGHSDGACYPIERFSFSESEKEKILKSAYELAELKNALLEKSRKNTNQ